MLDGDGAVIARGAVGGPPVSLPTGTYVVEVAVEPPVRFDEVYVAPDGSVELTLPTSERPAGS